MNNSDKQKLINAIVQSSGGKADQSKLSNAVDKGDISTLLNALSKEDRQRITDMMSDKKNLSAFLNSDRAKSALKSILKDGGKNGRTQR